MKLWPGTKFTIFYCQSLTLRSMAEGWLDGFEYFAQRQGAPTWTMSLLSLESSHDKPTQTKYQESPCHLDCLARLIKCILQQTKSLKHLAQPSGLEFCIYFLLGSLRYSGLRGWSLDSKSLRPQISPQPPSSLLLLRDACPVPSARTKIGFF